MGVCPPWSAFKCTVETTGIITAANLTDIPSTHFKYVRLKKLTQRQYFSGSDSQLESKVIAESSGGLV